MPQINRIRVNNVKYNFGTQYYDDFMMRFHCRNTIYDLANGGGKSLLMLLLLQNVIPNCTLDEKQPIEKLFRQGSGNTVIHSLIEWKLDAENSDGYKYMTTGFCARKAKDIASEQDLSEDMEAQGTVPPRDNASVEYFNYCIFYQKFGDNDIKNLPLAKDGERITYNGLKNYLRELEKNDFYVSVKIFERKGEYQSFISRYGLYESEWEIIRGINKTEGHVRTYFETNYKTSRKVVEDLLIEEIIQKSFHNKLAVGNDEGLMAQTLLDIKDTLARLSKKNAQISNYDRQIQVLGSFAEYVSGYAALYEEKERLQQQLFEMLLMCKKQLAGYRQQEEAQQQALAGLRAESENQQRLIQTAEVLREQVSLKSMEELIAVNEAKRNTGKEREAMLRNQLDLLEAAGEYREYCEYEQLFCELQTAIAGRVQSDEELAGELAALVAAIKPLYEEKEQALSAEIMALKQRRADNEAAGREAERKYKRLVEQQAAAAGFLEYTKSEIADREERAAKFMEKAGLLVMENAKEELDNCKTVQESAKHQINHAQQTLEEIRGALLEKKECRASYRAEQESLDRQCAEAEKDRRRRKEAQEKLEQLKAVYAESDTKRAGQVILENYRKMEAECSRLEQECRQLEQFLVNAKQGVYAPVSYQRDKVGEYLKGRYGEDVKEGGEWLETLDTAKKERVLQAVPYAEYAFVIENDFTRIREDKVLADFGRSEYVIPVFAAAVADAVLDNTWQQYTVFAKKDTSFLKDTVQREREVKLAEEELETVKARLVKLSDRKDIVWSDFLLLQRLTEAVDSEKIQWQETLFVRREQLKKEAEACQEAIAELTQQENTVAGAVGQAKQQLEQARERSEYLKEVTELSDILRTAYQEKQEFAKQAAQAEEAQLAVQAERRAAGEAVRTASEQIKNAQETLAAMRKTWQESYQTYDTGAVPMKAEMKELESRFMGLKMALDEKNADMGDKEALLKHYRTAMEKCEKAVLRRHFTMEALAKKAAENALPESAQEAVRRMEDELSQIQQQMDAVSGELEAQNALMNRLQGSIAHGIGQVEEKYGSFEMPDCDNPEQFIAQHRQFKERIAQDIAQMQKQAAQQAGQVRDFLVMEKDLTRIVEKTGMQVPQHIQEEWIKEVGLTDYETVQKEFEKLCALEVKKLEEFVKKKEKLTEELLAFDAKELAAEVKVSVSVPKSAAAAKELAAHIAETNTLIALEKERVSKGISDMEKIKENFENRCIQICCNIKTELDRLPKLSCITMDSEVISIIGLFIPYVKEDSYKERMASYIDETVLMAESFEGAQERLRYIRNRLSWKRLFSVIVTDMNAIRVNLYKRERMKDQSRYLKYEEAVGSTGQSQGIYIQFLIAVIHYISSINAPAASQSVLGKTIFIDNPFGAAKDIYIWEPIFKLLKTNHVQLIVPARGATPAITGRFDVNYILGQKLVDNRQQTVVVDYYSRTKNEELEYTRMDYEQAVFDFV